MDRTGLRTVLWMAIALTLNACGAGDRIALMAAAKAYNEAWASRDVARIVERHADDSTFTLHVDGHPQAVGKTEIAEQFRQILASAPDYSAEPYEVKFGDNFVVILYRINSTPDQTMRLGKRQYVPDGSRYSVDAMDYITFENGLRSFK